MNKPWLAGLVMAVILGGAADAQAPISGKLRQAASVADASQREPRLIQLLGSIDPSAPMDAATRAELELLADYRSELMRPANPEHRVHLEQPAFPIAARARALRAAALEADAARAWLARWRRDSVLPAADLRQPGTLSRVAELASDAEVSALAANRPDWPDAAMAVLAERSGDAALIRDWLVAADGAGALRFLARVPARLDAGLAFETLTAIIESNPALASAATLPLASVDDPRRIDWLLAALDRPAYGASAAQALSRLPDSLWLDRLDAAASASGWRHRALALRWNGTPPAAERLRQWQRNGVLPAALAREVASWTE